MGEESNEAAPVRQQLTAARNRSAVPFIGLLYPLNEVAASSLSGHPSAAIAEALEAFFGRGRINRVFVAGGKKKPPQPWYFVRFFRRLLIHTISDPVTV